MTANLFHATNRHCGWVPYEFSYSTSITAGVGVHFNKNMRVLFSFVHTVVFHCRPLSSLLVSVLA